MTLIVAAAIVDSVDAPSMLLAAQRSYPPELAGLWEFPGGKREADETPEEGVAREIREELGCDIELGPRVRSTFPDGDGPLARPGLVMRLWLARVCGEGVPRLGESHSEIRWVPLGEAQNLPWIPADRDIVAAVVACHQ